MYVEFHYHNDTSASWCFKYVASGWTVHSYFLILYNMIDMAWYAGCNLIYLLSKLCGSMTASLKTIAIFRKLYMYVYTYIIMLYPHLNGRGYWILRKAENVALATIVVFIWIKCWLFYKIWVCRENYDTVECPYNAVQYGKILHKWFQELRQNITQMVDPHKTPHTSPLGYILWTFF